MNEAGQSGRVARRRGPSWLSFVWPGAMHRAILRSLGPLRGTETVLDVGCGSGGLLRAVQRRWPGAATMGVDPSERAIEIARQEVPVGVFLTGHAEALALASSSVDVVTTTFSFHHWSDQAAGLREIARVLRAGGTLLLLDPSPLPRISRVLGAHRFTSKRELAALFEQAGLRVETSRSWLACCRITRASKE